MVLPEIGDPAPPFEAETARGLVRFPEYAEGKWCVIFAHPANFTSAWEMFSVFLSKKERWLDERHAKVIGLTNVPLRQNDWLQKTQRYVGIYLRVPSFRICTAILPECMDWLQDAGPCPVAIGLR